MPLDPERFPNGNADALVVGVRVWGTQGNPILVLDVELVHPGACPMPVAAPVTSATFP